MNRPTFRDWLEAGGVERRSKRVRRTRAADGCPRVGGHLIGFPCGRCDRAEAVDAERARRGDGDRDGYRASAVRTLNYVAAERSWDWAHRGEERNQLAPWARPMIARAAWYREHATEVLP